MSSIQKVTIKEVEFIAHRLAAATLEYDEPIPEFNTRFPNILESCLLVPFQTFSKKLLYPGLVAKASILFYLMVKNRPFQNGNKRIAMTTLMVFLFKNGKWLRVNREDFYKFTMLVAAGPADSKEEFLKIITKFLNKHLVDA